MWGRRFRLPTDPQNRFVTGLTRENFKVLEDGVEQQISQFSSEDLPISVGIVVDVSGSIGSKMEAERTAVSEFLKTARPQDEFSSCRLAMCRY